MKISNFRFVLAKYSIYIFLYCLIFLLQRFLVVHLFDVNKYVLFNKVYVHEVVIAITSFLFVKHSFKINKPG